MEKTPQRTPEQIALENCAKMLLAMPNIEGVAIICTISGEGEDNHEGYWINKTNTITQFSKICAALHIFGARLTTTMWSTLLRAETTQKQSPKAIDGKDAGPTS